MEYARIPTDLLMDRLKDWELAALVTYTLLWGLKEEEPTKEMFLRIKSEKHFNFAKTYHEGIKKNIDTSIRIMDNKRTADKIRYYKNKGIDIDSVVGTPTESALITTGTSDYSKRSESNKEREETQEMKVRKQAMEELEKMKQKKIFPPIPVGSLLQSKPITRKGD